MKAKIIITLLLFVCVAFFAGSGKVSYATGADFQSEAEIEQELSNNIFNQLNKLDFSALNDIYANSQSKLPIFGNGNFKEKLIEIVNGNYFSKFDNLFSAIISLAFDGFIEFLPIFFTIVAICVLSVLVSHFKTGNNSGVNDVINFACFAVVLILISSIITQVMQTTYSALVSMQTIMEAAFPIMLTLLTAIGAVASVAIYKPIVAILTGGVTLIFTNVLYPMFIIAFVFILINNLSSTIKFKQFNDFISSSFKWVSGFVLTLFSSFLVVQGISAGKFDSVSIKATKFAIKSYVPIIGNFVSDGFDFIVLSSVLIKNAVGVGVLVLILITVLLPIIKLIILKLSLQLLSAVVEPIGNNKITSFLSATSKILAYPLAVIIGVTFMFLLTVSLMMTTANVF